MKVRALYHQTFLEDDEDEDPLLVHEIAHDGGGFRVSSQEVGIAIQNFLNAATTSDIYALHGWLLSAFRIALDEETKEV